MEPQINPKIYIYSGKTDKNNDKYLYQIMENEDGFETYHMLGIDLTESFVHKPTH
jgi:hypothetical protein